MIGQDSHEDINKYGWLPWFGGLVLAGLIILLMFVFAVPIS